MVGVWGAEGTGSGLAEVSVERRLRRVLEGTNLDGESRTTEKSIHTAWFRCERLGDCGAGGGVEIASS